MRTRAALLLCVLFVCLGALGLAQDPADGLHQGIRQIRAGQLTEAKASLDRAIEALKGAQRSHDLSLAYAHKAMLLLGEKREGEAKECLKQAMAANGRLRLSPTLFPPEMIALYLSMGGKVMESKAPTSETGSRQGETLKYHTMRSKKPFVFAGLFAVGAPLATKIVKDAGSSSEDDGESSMLSDDDGDGFSETGGDCNDTDKSINPNGKVGADFGKLLSGSTSCVIPSGAEVIAIVNRTCSFQNILVRVDSCGTDGSSRWCSSPSVSWTSVAAGSSWSYTLASSRFECYSTSPVTSIRSRDDVITITSGTGTLTFSRSISYDRAQCPKC